MLSLVKYLRLLDYSVLCIGLLIHIVLYAFSRSMVIRSAYRLLLSFIMALSAIFAICCVCSVLHCLVIPNCSGRMISCPLKLTRCCRISLSRIYPRVFSRNIGFSGKFGLYLVSIFELLACVSKFTSGIGI